MPTSTLLKVVTMAFGRGPIGGSLHELAPNGIAMPKGLPPAVTLDEPKVTDALATGSGRHAISMLAIICGSAYAAAARVKLK